MKTYDYVLLDWDGNLAKTLDVWMHATRAPLEKRGISISDREIAIKCFGRPTLGYTELGVTDVDVALREMDELAAAMLPEVELYPDALIVLDELKLAGKKTALITSSPRRNVLKLLDKYEIHHFFDIVIAHEDTEEHKPHPAPLEKALSELGGTKEQAVMIGDSDKDIGAGKNAGVDSILFYPEDHERFYDLDELKRFEPTYIIDDFRAVLGIVQGRYE